MKAKKHVRIIQPTYPQIQIHKETLEILGISNILEKQGHTIRQTQQAAQNFIASTASSRGKPAEPKP